MRLKRTLPLLSLAASMARAQDPSHYPFRGNRADLTGASPAAAVAVADEVAPDPGYSAEQCDGWISHLLASDSDSSGGVSRSEYHAFLASIDDPPHVQQYFAEIESFDSLHWALRVVHKSLACHCGQLGMDDGCCEGDDAEIILLELMDDDRRRRTTGQECHSSWIGGTLPGGQNVWRAKHWYLLGVCSAAPEILGADV